MKTVSNDFSSKYDNLDISVPLSKVIINLGYNYLMFKKITSPSVVNLAANKHHRAFAEIIV